MTDTNWRDLSGQALHEYANTLGIEYTDVTTDEEIHLQIASVLGETLEIPSAVPKKKAIVKKKASVKKAARAKRDELDWMDDRVEVTIHSRDESGQGVSLPEIVAINGKNFVIQPNKRVPVPRAVVEALSNAIETRYRQGGTELKPELHSYESHSIPFTVHMD